MRQRPRVLTYRSWWHSCGADNRETMTTLSCRFLSQQLLREKERRCRILAVYQADVHNSWKRELVLFSNLARVMVRTPFWRVKSLIKDFIAMLLEEASRGVSRKAYCGEEAANDTGKKVGLDSHIERQTSRSTSAKFATVSTRIRSFRNLQG